METNTIKHHKQLGLITQALEETQSVGEISKLTKLPRKVVQEELDALAEVLKTQYSQRYLEVVNKQAELLDEITTCLMPKVRMGDYKSADIAIKSITAMNILLGLNAPQKREITEQKTLYTLKLTKKVGDE